MFALAEELPEATDDSVLWWPGHLSPVLMSALNRSLWSRLVRSASAPFHCFGHFNLAPAMFALAEELPEATDDSILWWPGHLSPVLMSALNRSLWSRLVRSAFPIG